MPDAQHIENASVLWIRETFEWMGSRSGYDQLCTPLAKLLHRPPLSVWRHYGPSRRLACFVLSRLARWRGSGNPTDLSKTATELAAILKLLAAGPSLIHVLYMDHYSGLLSKWRHNRRFHLVGTAHQPPAWWETSKTRIERLRKYDALIAVSRAQAAFIESHAAGSVHFVPHGIDVDFFSPQENASPAGEGRRFVFCGVWRRDLETLETVIDTFAGLDKTVEFDLIVPRDPADLPALQRLVHKKQVIWHRNINDQQLRDLYRQATAFILPLHDCTANNALLEAVACGLPVVATNVGGLPDYTCNSFADLVAPRDSDSFVQSMLHLLNNREERDRRARAARRYALQNLAWDKIAIQTLEVYREAALQR